MDIHEMPYRIKSARRKKRLVKTDRDKQLIRLDKRHTQLWDQRNKLPLIELEQPYQRGWKRFFVLRDDIERGPKAGFYEDLLKKINTLEYCNDRSFKRRKRRKHRYVYVQKAQALREFYQRDWDSGKLKLTDDERACFTRTEVYDVKHRTSSVKYVFTEPWRYVLKIEPYIVTHRKQVDCEIETELAWIDNHIDNHHLWARINRLTRRKESTWYKRNHERAKYINTIKNIPRNSAKEAYLDLKF